MLFNNTSLKSQSTVRDRRCNSRNSFWLDCVSCIPVNRDEPFNAVSASRWLAILVTAICCDLSSTSANAGILLADTLDLGRNAEPPLVVSTAFAYAVPQPGFFEIGLLSDETACGTSRKVEHWLAESSGSPVERLLPFQTPISSQLELASLGQTITGPSSCRTRNGGGGSAGMFSKTRSVLKPLRSGKLLVREFQLLLDAPLFELFHPS